MDKVWKRKCSDMKDDIVSCSEEGMKNEILIYDKKIEKTTEMITELKNQIELEAKLRRDFPVLYVEIPNLRREIDEIKEGTVLINFKQIMSSNWPSEANFGITH